MLCMLFGALEDDGFGRWLPCSDYLKQDSLYTSLHGITITEYTCQLIQLVQSSEDRHMDYRPFPTREHMLLYLLVNGTKPVVGSGELLQHSLCNLHDTCGISS